MDFQELVQETVYEIEQAAAEMGDGFDQDIANDIVHRRGKSLDDIDQDNLRDEVFFHVANYWEECQHNNAVLSDDNEPATFHCPDCGENFIGLSEG